MTLYDRYINGQTEQVYQDIYALGQDAFLPANLPDIEKVLTETFQRVAYNLEIIYAELKNIDYLFKTEFEYNFQRPLHKPLPDTDTLLKKLDKAVEPYGFVPLSLKYFYSFPTLLSQIFPIMQAAWPFLLPWRIFRMEAARRCLHF